MMYFLCGLCSDIAVVPRFIFYARYLSLIRRISVDKTIVMCILFKPFINLITGGMYTIGVYIDR